MRFKNKQIIVTGATSGIGKQTALYLNSQGAKIIAISRRSEKLKDLIEILKGENYYYSYDLTYLEGIGNLMNEITNMHGKSDGLVYSAGVGTTIGINSLYPLMLANVFTINYYPFIEFVRHFCKKGNFNINSSIVGVSSIASMQGNVGKTAYCASKAAMDASIRCIAKEIFKKGIRINNVAPSLIETPITKQYFERTNESKEISTAIYRQYMGIGKPQDVAGVISFLLSDESRFMTGLTIPVDGGRLTT